MHFLGWKLFFLFLFNLLLLHKYASKQIKLNWFKILVALAQYIKVLQSHMTKK